jgi:flavocytochrome c
MLRRNLLIGSGILACEMVVGLPSVMAKDTQFDVAVVGGGIAGVTAALEAAQRGKKVVLVQVQPILGGDAYLSTGWFYACNSPLQKRIAKVKDSPEQFKKDSLAISEGRRDPMWTGLVAENSGRDIEWLEKNGVVFENKVTRSMGSTIPRAIQVDGYGRALITALAKALEKTGNATVLLNTRCTGLVIKDKKLTGITVESKGSKRSIPAKNVILASGGFPFNKEMVKKYAPQFAKMGAVGDPNLKGDGVRFALEQGAQARNLGVLNIVPTTDVDTRIYLTSGALSGGGILVNEKGERFCNELKSYTATALAMLDQKHVYEILVPETHSKVKVLAEKKVIRRADSVEELAKKIGVPEDALRKEIEAHNAATAGKAKDRFGREIYKAPLKPPFYFMEVMPLILQTLGGIVTNEHAQVLDKSNKVIYPNLFAVGDVISGYLDGGYRTGDALMFGVVTGRIAGDAVN